LFGQATTSTELLSLQQPQLYKVDVDKAGPLIYANINADSNKELKDYLAAAKAQRRLERQRMLERAKKKVKISNCSCLWARVCSHGRSH